MCFKVLRAGKMRKMHCPEDDATILHRKDSALFTVRILSLNYKTARNFTFLKRIDRSIELQKVTQGSYAGQ